MTNTMKEDDMIDYFDDIIHAILMASYQLKDMSPQVRIKYRDYLDYLGDNNHLSQKEKDTILSIIYNNKGDNND